MNSYVTLVSNPDFLTGAVALARSLAMVKSKFPLTVLALDGIEGIERLKALGCRIQIVEPLALSEGFQARHSRSSQHKQAPFTKGNKPDFHNPLNNFLKLRLWEMEQHEKVVWPTTHG